MRVLGVPECTVQRSDLRRPQTMPCPLWRQHCCDLGWSGAWRASVTPKLPREEKGLPQDSVVSLFFEGRSLTVPGAACRECGGPGRGHPGDTPKSWGGGNSSHSRQFCSWVTDPVHLEMRTQGPQRVSCLLKVIQSMSDEAWIETQGPGLWVPPAPAPLPLPLTCSLPCLRMRCSESPFQNHTAPSKQS